MPTRRYVFAGAEVTVCCVQGKVRGRQPEETHRCFKLNPETTLPSPGLAALRISSFINKQCSV